MSDNEKYHGTSVLSETVIIFFFLGQQGWE